MAALAAAQPFLCYNWFQSIANELVKLYRLDHAGQTNSSFWTSYGGGSLAILAFLKPHVVKPSGHLSLYSPQFVNLVHRVPAIRAIIILVYERGSWLVAYADMMLILNLLAGFCTA